MIHVAKRIVPADVDLETTLLALAGPYRIGKTETASHKKAAYLVLTESPVAPRLAHTWRHDDGMKVAALYIEWESRILDIHWIDDANEVVAGILAEID